MSPKDIDQIQLWVNQILAAFNAIDLRTAQLCDEVAELNKSIIEK